jgi:hypothetical protein
MIVPIITFFFQEYDEWDETGSSNENDNFLLMTYSLRMHPSISQIYA